MRFIHTADWHLGRIFHGVHLTDDQAYVLEQFIGLVHDARPDAVLIAGDIYDRSVPPHEAVQLLDEVLYRIVMDCRVPVLIIAGNHDSARRLGFGHRLLARQGLHITSQPDNDLAPVVIEDCHGPVYFCPVPYVDPPVVRDCLGVQDARGHDSAMAVLVDYWQARVPGGARKVALAHAFVAGGEGSESERPLSIGGADKVQVAHFRAFNYTALGHLHKAQPAGEEQIRYAGSLMKYSFSEAEHKKSVTLVEMDARGVVTREEIALCPRRDVRRLDGFLRDLLVGPPPGVSREDYIMVTLRDSGAILDAMGKLREVYPNVLHIERPHLNCGGDLRGPGGDHRRLGELDLFASFFQQVAGEELTSEQQRVIAGIVEQIYRQDYRPEQGGGAARLTEQRETGVLA
ncbi:exonuclease SbcCD subunit D [Desulfallas thermosapovorans]|uniref:Nuclease SbcCD subunit D n=1 Tax=Desulfallas thermosapovorans DSM 6562 TaxID=1121431 RepID=A0A5S4ZQD3_9FIRM|nr:exonuclease SbcCD subunit D [Desulfallas thermosapovorans]TYO95105.1 exodeoxyribonuclease I subunit D [Desulfallas thermosapovorans DSM 6562]